MRLVNADTLYERLHSAGGCDAAVEWARGYDAGINDAIGILETEPTVREWIPVSERLPENDVPVNIVWTNHKPESYYAHIKDKPFTATGLCHNGKWYWYSCICEEMLVEYGRCETDEVDAEIEILFWMPLPEPPEV